MPDDLDLIDVDLDAYWPDYGETLPEEFVPEEEFDDDDF